MTGLSSVLQWVKKFDTLLTIMEPPLPDVSPVFSFDVRLALDNFGSLSMRVRAATRSAWENLATETRHSRA